MKNFIKKGIITVLLLVITLILDLFYVRLGKRLLWALFGYILYWTWEVEDEE